MDKSTLDTLKLRDMMTVPELSNPMEAVMKQAMDGLHKKEMAVIEDILRHHIDCPIEGELTREKVKAARIRGVMYSDNFPQSRIENNGKDICISVISGLMGVVQGDWLIGAGGARRPLTKKERDFYELQECMEQMGKNVPDMSGENRIFASDIKELYVRFYAKGRTTYFVSRYGNVLSTTDPESSPATWHLIATYNGKGYRRVRLQGRTFKVHRLVAEAFVPNPDNLPYVLHKDGDRENNHYKNLEWSDKQSNHPGYKS